jgi:endo-alpha-1,4-polygalactosaminidase (GH114 family)
MRPLRPIALLLFAFAVAIPGAAARDDTERKPDGDAPLARRMPPIVLAQAAIEPREEMRRFVERITASARRRNPNFLVVAQGGLELLERERAIDDEPPALARPYVDSIDGVLVEGLQYGIPAFGAPTEEAAQRLLLDRAERARAAGLTVLVMDYAGTAQATRDAFAKNRKLGFASLAAAVPATASAALPSYPARPFDENAGSVRTLKGVRNYAYLADLGSWDHDGLVAALGQTNHDLIVVDAFLRRKPLSPPAVEALKYKRLGSRRLVFARIDIGFAAGDRYYWQADWRAGSPQWIETALPGDAERHPVRYWHPDWQRIIAGDGGSYLEGVLGLGFDGVVLAGVDAFRCFDGDDPPAATPGAAPSLSASAASH